VRRDRAIDARRTNEEVVRRNAAASTASDIEAMAAVRERLLPARR
jgi:hypothetical protein